MKFPIKIGIMLSLFSFSLILTALISHYKKRPNIIFFIADDMTRDMFNFLPEGKGKNLTPNLDKLVAEGTIMMNQHVTSTVCTPSRYNVLTGKYASRATNPEMIAALKKNDGQRVVQWNTHIMPKENNVARILQKHGYFTGAVGKNHVVEVAGYQKVELSDDFNNPVIKKRQLDNYNKTVTAYHQVGFEFADGIFYENPDFNGPRSLAVHNLDWTTEAALHFLDQTGDTPFFLYFATTLPHGPQKADRAWNADRRICPKGILDKAPSVLPHKSTIPRRLKEAGISPTDRKANLLWMDDALGALIDKLKAIDAYDNTIIFFFNDHGQYAKGTVYQGATHNPSLVWKKGGFKIGKRSDALVSNVDFAPTMLDFAQVKVKKPYQYDGQSFAANLRNKRTKNRTSIYFEIGYSRGVRMGNYKYITIRYPQWVKDISLTERKAILDKYNKILAGRGKGPNNLDPQAPFGHVQIIPGGGDAEFLATQRYPNYTDPDQLYDLSLDPKEQNNLVAEPEYQKILLQLKSELSNYVKTIPGSFGEFKKN